MRTLDTASAVNEHGSYGGGAERGHVPSRQDAVQGGLGDAALIAMLGAVAAHRPDALRQAIRRLPDGGARVVLHQVSLDPMSTDWVPTGQMVWLDVSPELPLLPYEGESNTAYADVLQSGTLWPALLEKGFAALDTTWGRTRRATFPERGYTRLDLGWSVWETSEALAQLVGTRAGIHILRDETVEVTIRYLFAHRCPVLVQTLPPSGPDAEVDQGVYPGHAYEVTEISGQAVHLRNPWGVCHPVVTIGTLIRLTGGVIVTLKP